MYFRPLLGVALLCVQPSFVWGIGCNIGVSVYLAYAVVLGLALRYGTTTVQPMFAQWRRSPVLIIAVIPVAWSVAAPLMYPVRDGVFVGYTQSRLNAKEMAEELAKSHVCVSPSFIDNSPNAVCEAQLVGMPVVSTYTGGVPSLIEEGRTGLFFPTGDAPMLAARLREVFENDALAIRLGEQSYDVARRCHDPDAVVKQVLLAYDEVLKKVAGESCLTEAPH